MITAASEQERERQRARSAASGPPFDLPTLAPLAGIGLPSLPSGPVCSPDPAPVAPAPVGAGLGGLLGRSVGSGQCVALVQAAVPALGPTAGWSGGAAVQGNLSLKPGTPVATFDGGGRYANALDGSSHAAIYLGQDGHGMLVLDQWAGKDAAVRTIPWSNPGGAPANTGSAFRVVTTG